MHNIAEEHLLWGWKGANVALVTRRLFAFLGHQAKERLLSSGKRNETFRFVCHDVTEDLPADCTRPRGDVAPPPEFFQAHGVNFDLLG